MDAGASASARPAGLPVHDARPVGCAHPASRARPAGAASHSRKGVGRGLDRPLAASAAGPRPAITARRPVNSLKDRGRGLRGTEKRKMNTSVNELLSNPAFRPLVLLDVLAVFLMIICLIFRRMRKGYYVEQANDARKATMLKEASQRPVEKSEAVEQAVDNAGGFDLDEWRKAHAPESVPDRRPWFFKTVMGRGLVCLLTKVIPILLPVVWLSLVVIGMLPNPLALFDFSTDPQPSLLNPADGCFWLLLVMFIVVVLHDSLPALLRRLGWMMDKPKTASASLTSMVESHYGVSNLEVDWFGAAAGGVPPFDGLYSCRYDTGRRRNNGVLRVRNHRVWLYGPDGCEEERHGH